MKCTKGSLLTLVVGASLSVVVAGCSESSGGSGFVNSDVSGVSAAGGAGQPSGQAPGAAASAKTSGELQVVIHDAPADVDEVWVTFDRVEAHHADQGWLVISTASRTLDLLTLQDGVVAELGLASLPVGSYSQVRLHVVASHVIVDGAQKELKIPSGGTSGLKLIHGFEIEGGARTKLTLDWDVGAHLIKTGKRYQLRPTIVVESEVTLRPKAVSDFNGDGRPDFFLFGHDRFATEAARIFPYVGTGAGIPTVPAAEILEPPPYTLNHGISRARNLGDLDGDGYTELLIARNFDDEGVQIYRGGPSGIGATPDLSLQNPRGAQPTSINFGAQFGLGLGLGDFNGDGHKDLAVGSVGVVDVFPGSASGITATRTTELLVSDFSGMGAGDFDGDGYADLALGRWTVNGNSGEVWIHRGSAAGLNTSPDLVIPAPAPGGRFGLRLVTGEDYDRDGHDDLAVGAVFHPNGDGTYGNVHVYLGSATGLSPVPSVSLRAGKAFGGSLNNVGDYDGDGYPDLAVGEAGDPSLPSFKVYIFRGGSGGVSSTPHAVLQSPTSERWGFERVTLAPRPVGLGDLDGDGRTEIAIGQARPGTYADPELPAVVVYRGGQTGSLSTPDVVMPAAPSGTHLDVGEFPAVGYEAQAD